MYWVQEYRCSGCGMGDVLDGDTGEPPAVLRHYCHDLMVHTVMMPKRAENGCERPQDASVEVAS